MRTQVEIISEPNYLVRIFSVHFLLFRKFRRRKITEIALEFVYFSFTKVCNIQNPQYSKLFWFPIDSSVLLNEGVQSFFHDICHFFVCTADCNKLYKRIT